MAKELDSTLREFRGTGTVFIAWDPHPDSLCYWAIWDSSIDGSGRILEKSPLIASIEEIVAWGRARTKRVLIRPKEDEGSYYWAGLGEPSSEDALLKPLQT
jgi:hypothetical protein